MEAYKRWVRINKDCVHSLESLANGLTWLLPERFSSSEIGPEAVTAILGIITAINEHIIDTTPTRKHRGFSEPHSFPYSLCISAIKDLETLVEVVAEHYCGHDKKWNFIAVTEATKVLVRLALFRNSGYKMLLHGGETPNTEQHPGFPSSQHNTGTKLRTHGEPGWRTFNGQNRWNLEGRALSALNRFGENAMMVSDPVWVHRVQHQHAIMEPPYSVIERPTLSKLVSEKGVHGVLFLVGELLFVTRPLIYVLFIRKYAIRSWIPWFLSLGVDLVSMGLLSLIMKSRLGVKEQLFHLTDPEQDEVSILHRFNLPDSKYLSYELLVNKLKRRKLLWALYLMRDPFFSKYTRQRLEGAEKVLEPIPLVGLLTAKFVELLVGAQTRYTYMSGS